LGLDAGGWFNQNQIIRMAGSALRLIKKITKYQSLHANTIWMVEHRSSGS
jgi:hypothetical protein